jgi:hypothetical protein
MDTVNDLSPLTIAGHPFAVEAGGAKSGMSGMSGKGGITGGMLSLRISLGNAPLLDLARALAKLEGVRVTSGPAIVSRGDCYLIHCPGFKMVLSTPVPADDFAQALLSRTIEPTLSITCELAVLFARLMSPAPPAELGSAKKPKRIGTPEHQPASRAETQSGPSGWARTSVLRRAALQPGKTLIRKTPLARRTPLARGRFSAR